MDTTSDRQKGFLEAIFRLVDRLYTPAEGVKRPDALKQVEWLLICNQPGVDLTRMIAKGMTTNDEYWEINVYLHQVRDELLGLGLQPSIWADQLMPTEEVARKLS